VEPGDVVFGHACQLGFEGIVSKRLGSPYRSGRSRHWVKSKNPKHPSVKRGLCVNWCPKFDTVWKNLILSEVHAVADKVVPAKLTYYFRG
jgi:hypothetical protein